MADIEEKISSLLSSPEAVEQLMSVVKSLTGDSSSTPSAQVSPQAVLSSILPDSSDDADDDYVPAAENQSGSMGGLGDLLAAFGGGSGGFGGGSGGMDPNMLAMMMKLLGAYSSGDDQKSRLLNSLKPYVREERREKIDKAIQIVRLARVAKIALDGFGGGDVHV